ncbi:MAG: hypothetical protein L6R37_000944 [Teloschistes peruensis]|nr:MAG: hypothetical protein L6R37_000944 [Teloschistes peruensis]
MKLRLSTSNILSGGPSIVRRPISEKSNVELLNGLRLNFASCKEAATTVDDQVAGNLSNGHDSEKKNKIPFESWTSLDSNCLHIPSKAFQATPLTEESSEYDITVKLFLLPGSRFADWRLHLQEAIAAVLQELSVESINLLIVSFPGISFDADTEGRGDCGSNNIDASDSELSDAMLYAWRQVELLKSSGVALQIGLAEFGQDRLSKFLLRTKHRPTVDQINVRDCCVVPESMMLFAKQENLELLTHNDCTNILPQGTLRELLDGGENGAGVLAGASGEDEGLRGDLKPEWVVKYTAVVRDRGVIENKGYFASAELSEKRLGRDDQ